MLHHHLKVLDVNHMLVVPIHNPLMIKQYSNFTSFQEHAEDTDNPEVELPTLLASQPQGGAVLLQKWIHLQVIYFTAVGIFSKFSCHPAIRKSPHDVNIHLLAVQHLRVPLMPWREIIDHLGSTGEFDSEHAKQLIEEQINTEISKTVEKADEAKKAQTRKTMARKAQTKKVYAMKTQARETADEGTSDNSKETENQSDDDKNNS
jgi:hypothetical protein